MIWYDIYSPLSLTCRQCPKPQCQKVAHTLGQESIRGNSQGYKVLQEAMELLLEVDQPNISLSVLVNGSYCTLIYLAG